MRLFIAHIEHWAEIKSIIMLNSCQAERDFIKQSIMNNIRVDGRRNTGRRSLVIKKEVISHLPGSSYVYIEYENV